MKALYPSLEIERCARICGERVEGTAMNFQGIDYKWATKYIALNMKQHEITRADLQRIVPRKLAKH